MSEAAVVGIPDEIKGETSFAFVVLKDDVQSDEQTIRTTLNSHIAKGIAKFAVPKDIIIVDGLPKTRSGKIMRRILRKIAATNEKDFSKVAPELGDISTLDKPEVVERIMMKRSLRS